MKKTALVTGATSGIGLEIARLLAKQGWNLILVNRSQGKTDRLLAELQSAYPDQEIAGFIADLMDTADIRKVASEISAKYSEISALYNNAGVLTDEYLLSAQGHESHFAVNTLAPYLLTSLLRPQLKAGSSHDQPSVVANTSSLIFKTVKKLDVTSLATPGKSGGLLGAYAQSKAALSAFSDAMADELLKDDILIYSVCPGPVKTPMTVKSDGMPWFMRLLGTFMNKTPQQQAPKFVNAVQQAVSEGKTGLFITNGKRSQLPELLKEQALQAELKGMLDKLSAA